MIPISLHEDIDHLLKSSNDLIPISHHEDRESHIIPVSHQDDIIPSHDHSREMLSERDLILDRKTNQKSI